jgi:hypothetical protein
LALSEKIKIFDEEFEEHKKRFPEDGQQFQIHISNWKLSVGNLYAMKANKLKDGKFPVYGQTNIA